MKTTMRNKLLSFVLTFMMILSLSSVAFADSKIQTNNQKSCKAKIDISAGKMMSFDQMVRQISKEENKKEDDVINEFIYAEIGTKKAFKNFTKDEILKTMKRKQYFRFTDRVQCKTNEVRPKIRFYCEVSTSGTYVGIYEIKRVSLENCGKNFKGEIYANLENAYTIYWEVNGDFFKHGNPQVNGSISLNLGEEGTIEFGLSGAFGHIVAVDDWGRKKVGVQ